MIKRQSFYVAAAFSFALFMSAGCATQNAVQKEESIVPAPVVKTTEQSKPAVTSYGQSAAINASQAAPPKTIADGQQADKSSSTSQLQSALEKIYFNFDSADLSEAARTTLTKNASVLIKEPSAKIRIEGNCDERGSAEYNLALGERRAKSAQQYLQTLGVKPDRLSIISYGKEKPAVQGSDEPAMAKNRRDEFVVLTK
ncbi:MAG: peptidoglycan-associated lipoprotein Pal [Geobacteraceae bacterium]|nr:peptidoglycan-associated lipoprotein Pal [Geobacteraceae bacterium]